MAFLLVVLRRHPVNRAWDQAIFSEIVKLGRWGLLGNVITWFQTQSYIYLLLITIGPVGTALASGPRLFFAPLAFIASGWGVVYKPWGVRMARLNLMKPIRAMIIVTLLLVALSVAYGGILLAFHAQLVSFFLGEQYLNAGYSVFLLWSLYFCVQIVRGGITNTLQVAQEFRTLSLLSAAGSVVTIVVSYLLIMFWGVDGSLMGLVIGETVLVLLSSRRLLSCVKKGGDVTMSEPECARV
jgi:O-antigen/teichoic acid export membrane protein